MLVKIFEFKRRLLVSFVLRSKTKDTKSSMLFVSYAQLLSLAAHTAFFKKIKDNKKICCEKIRVSFCMRSFYLFLRIESAFSSILISFYLFLRIKKSSMVFVFYAQQEIQDIQEIKAAQTSCEASTPCLLKK